MDSHRFAICHGHVADNAETQRESCEGCPPYFLQRRRYHRGGRRGLPIEGCVPVVCWLLLVLVFGRGGGRACWVVSCRWCAGGRSVHSAGCALAAMSMRISAAALAGRGLQVSVGGQSAVFGRFVQLPRSGVRYGEIAIGAVEGPGSPGCGGCDLLSGCMRVDVDPVDT
jgi:hypothetical protein